jgi:hypothetical protein
MKRVLFAAVSSALLLSAPAAFAAYSTGAIRSIDTHRNEVVLDDGHAYFFATSKYLHNMKIGEKVKIHYQKKNGHNLATEISHAS